MFDSNSSSSGSESSAELPHVDQRKPLAIPPDAQLFVGPKGWSILKSPNWGALAATEIFGADAAKSSDAVWDVSSIQDRSAILVVGGVQVVPTTNMDADMAVTRDRWSTTDRRATLVSAAIVTNVSTSRVARLESISTKNHIHSVRYFAYNSTGHLEAELLVDDSVWSERYAQVEAYMQTLVYSPTNPNVASTAALATTGAGSPIAILPVPKDPAAVTSSPAVIPLAPFSDAAGLEPAPLAVWPPGPAALPTPEDGISVSDSHGWAMSTPASWWALNPYSTWDRVWKGPTIEQVVASIQVGSTAFVPNDLIATTNLAVQSLRNVMPLDLYNLSAPTILQHPDGHQLGMVFITAPELTPNFQYVVLVAQNTTGATMLLAGTTESVWQNYGALIWPYLTSLVRP